MSGLKNLLKLLIITFALFLPITVLRAAPEPDSLVQGKASTIYYYAKNGNRYVFPNEGTYFSWYKDFSHIIKITDAELAAMPLAGNVTYRPGIKMIKIQTDPKVYAVDQGGVLRWIQSETLALSLYGQFWDQAIDDIPDAFFVNYSIGQPIDSINDFFPYDVARDIDTINDDKNLSTSKTPRRADTEVANIVDAWRQFALDSINKIRAQFNKPPLIMNQLLNNIASIHSYDMAFYIKDLQHEGSLGERPDDRIRYGKVPDISEHKFITVPYPKPIGWSGENLGMITRVKFSEVEKNIQILHDAFLDEPPNEENHRTTMLSTFHPYSEIGIGLYLDDDEDRTLWLTEDFISRP